MTRTLLLILLCAASSACPNEDGVPGDRTCDETGCVCNAGLTACGDDCAELQSDLEHCGECDANVFDLGGSGCRNGVPFCATSGQLCQDNTPVCSDFGCRETPIFDCNPQQASCTDARVCVFNNFENLFECVRQECVDDLDCDSLGGVCENDECVQG